MLYRRRVGNIVYYVAVVYIIIMVLGCKNPFDIILYNIILVVLYYSTIVLCTRFAVVKYYNNNNNYCVADYIICAAVFAQNVYALYFMRI